MKISDKELQAAIAAYNKTGTFEASLCRALEAAYTVRKARKAAKRAKAKQKQTVYHVSLGEIDFNALRRQWSLNPAWAVPEPVKPAQPKHRFKVGDRVVHEVFGGVIIEVDNQLASYCVKFDDGGVGWVLGRSITPEPAKPEQPKHRFKVGDRVTYAKVGGGKVVRVDENDANRTYLVDFDRWHSFWPKNNELSPDPAKPEWNGKFEVGKAYRTRDGKMAEITDLVGSESYPVRGQLGGATATWTDGGVRVRGEESPSDLIGPWED